MSHQQTCTGELFIHLLDGKPKSFGIAPTSPNEEIFKKVITLFRLSLVNILQNCLENYVFSRYSEFII